MNIVQRFADRNSLNQILDHFKTNRGEIGKYSTIELREFINKTENQEFFLARELPAFYFIDDKETEICFQIKDGQDPTTYDELVASIESYSSFDCQLKSARQIEKFQIKGYREPNLQHTNQALIEYMTKKVFPHYGDMTDTSLIIILQPIPFTHTKVNFKELADALISQKINFKEVLLTYNENDSHRVIQKIYPVCEEMRLPIDRNYPKF